MADTTNSADFGDTNAVMARVATVISGMLDTENKSNFDAYVRRASDWTMNAELMRGLGKTYDEPKPVAPYVVHMNFKHDDNGTIIGWEEVTVGPERVGPPVQDVAPLPPPHPAGTVVLGKNFFGKYWAVGPGDTFPVDETTPMQPDGHTYNKIGAPVGPGWYLQLS